MHYLNIVKFKIIIALLMCPIVIQGFGEQETNIFEYNHPRSCKSNEYFDIDSFSCIECDKEKNLEPSENGKLNS